MDKRNTSQHTVLSLAVVVLVASGIAGWFIPAVVDEPPVALASTGSLLTLGSAVAVVFTARRLRARGFDQDERAGLQRPSDWMERAQSELLRSGSVGTNQAPGEHHSPLVTRVGEEIARSARYGHHLSVICIAVDMPVPDDPGERDAFHAKLATVGEIVRNSTRVSDAYGPSGSGGITIILAETDKRGARRVAEKLRRNVEVFPFGTKEPLTISLGIAEFRLGDNPSTLIARAEDACTLSQDAGGNTVS